MTETRIMRLRGFEYRTAILWDDVEHAECRITMRGGVARLAARVR